jgi:ribonuclease Z
MDLDVLFAGTAASAPTARRGLPATLVRRGGEKLLFDCGEGTQRQLVRSVGLLQIDEIFITHFHADHVLGLPGMLKTYGLQGREVPLRIHGPPGLRRLFDVLTPLVGRMPFEVELRELEPGEELDHDGYSIAAFAVEHGVTALGYVLVEDERPGRFDEDRARDLGVEPGPDFGRLQRGEPVGDVKPDQVLGEARRGRRIVIAGDSAPCEMTRAVAWRADLLVHEATFAAEDAERALATSHATARGAAELAAAAEVGLLALTHISSRYPVSALQEEARAAFENTIIPRDFDRVELPFPERGPATHIRGDSSDV